MENLNSLASDVRKLANRPDRIIESEISVRHAVLYYHRLDYFPRDLTHQSFHSIKNDSRGAARIPFSMFNNYRQIKSVFSFNPSCNGEKTEFRPASSYANLSAGKFLIENDSILIVSCNNSSFTVGYYQYPDVKTDINSWIARDYRDAVISKSLVEFYRVINDIGMMQAYQQQVGSPMQAGSYAHTILADQFHSVAHGYS
jgi:hypothetical protein